MESLSLLTVKAILAIIALLAIYILVTKKNRTTVKHIFWPDWRRTTILLLILVGIAYYVIYDIQYPMSRSYFTDAMTPWIGYMPNIIFYYTGTEDFALVLDIVSLAYFWVIASLVVWEWDTLKHGKRKR